MKRIGSSAMSRGMGWLRWEKVKLALIGLILAILCAAAQSTPLFRIDLPFLFPSVPSLTLLLTVATGFFTGEKEGAVMGLLSGFFAEATTGHGVMLLPLLYTLCGYLIGYLSKDRLAHNLLSFMVWVLMSSVWEQALRYGVMSVRAGKAVSAGVMANDLLPSMVMTVLFAPLMYWITKWIIKVFVRK